MYWWAMPKTKDYYEELGVSRDASQKEIQSAFRKLARKLHPDVNPADKEAESRFKAISEAHGVLSDPQKRKLYDRFGPDWQAAANAGMDPDQGPGPFGAPRGRYQTVDADSIEDLLGGMGGARGGFGDIFSSIFGGRGAASQSPVDSEGTIEITLQEAFRGTARQVVMPDGKRIELKVPAGVQDVRCCGCLDSELGSRWRTIPSSSGTVMTFGCPSRCRWRRPFSAARWTCQR